MKTLKLYPNSNGDPVFADLCIGCRGKIPIVRLIIKYGVLGRWQNRRIARLIVKYGNFAHKQNIWCERQIAHQTLVARLIIKYGIFDRKCGLILLSYDAALKAGRRLESWVGEHSSSQTRKRTTTILFLIREIYKSAGCMIRVTPNNKLMLIREEGISNHEYDKFMVRQGLEDSSAARRLISDYLLLSSEIFGNKRISDEKFI